MEKRLVSVIVLTCPERKKELWRCLTSVKNSSYNNIETLVVSNGCHPDLVKEIKSRFPEVNTILLPINSGCFGFNVGYLNAKGKYILSLDDDTSIKADTIEKIAKIFESKPKNVGIISPNAYNPKTKHYYSPLETKKPITFHGSSAFKKELFEKIGYYDADFFGPVFEDDFALRTVNAGYKIYFDKNIVINHYEKGGWRKRQIFLNARNKAWLNIKHFFLIFFPLLIVRDLVWIFLLPYRKKSIKALYYGIIGYCSGYFNFLTPLRKRRVVSYETQKKFIKNYLFGDLKRLLR